ncbi:hypothetical protein LQL77_07100 [Rhodococcus cerastii]|nr:hypothetical protein [Rhodococcus cerastii]
MRMMIIGMIAFTALGLMSCGQEPEAADPSVRDQACETIKVLSPGTVELGWAINTLADENSTAAEKEEALLETSAPGKRTEPYTCEGPVFERFAAEYEQ